MLKRLAGTMFAVVALTGPAFAWCGTDIYIERAAMAEAGHQSCGINNRKLVERYKDRAGFFTGLSPEAVERRVDRRAEILLARLTNASAVRTFCIRIRGRDF